MNWEAVSALSTAFTGCVIVVTALVGVYQLRQLRQQRRDVASIELMHSLQDIDFARAFFVIVSLPAGVSASDLRAAGPDVVEAAQIMAFRFETMGLLVYRGTIAFDVMEDLIGGAVLGVWDRLKDETLRSREERYWPTYCEWFQWLAEQLEKRGRRQQTAAHVRLKDWSPL